MLLYVFLSLLVFAGICFALSRVRGTRQLGISAAVVAGSSGIALVLAHRQQQLAFPTRDWAVLDTQSVQLALAFDSFSWLLACVVLFGGALALLALALALPSRLRGFGGLFGALLLLMLATITGLALDLSLLLPVVWALLAMLTFVALRSSGAQQPDLALPVGLLSGLASALCLLGAILAQSFALPGTLPAPVVLAVWTVVVLLVCGAAPFHGALEETINAPAGIVAMVLALGLPLLAGVSLLRFVAAQADLLPTWQSVLVALGLLSLVACAAGALGERRASRLVGWQFSAQIGLVLVAAGQRQAILTVAGPALLANAVVTTLVAYLAVALLERRAGTDDVTASNSPTPLLVPGVAFLVAAASAVGVPGTWGFWARQWLLDGLSERSSWAVPVMLAGSLLLALSYLAPFVAFLRVGAAHPASIAPAVPSTASRVLEVLPALAALPLLIFGVAPQALWNIWLVEAQRLLAPAATLAPPGLPGLSTQVLAAFAALALLTLPWITRRSGRTFPADPEDHGAVQTPDALAEVLQPLAWIAVPEHLFAGGWQSLQGASRVVRRAMALFEQRYYLAGLMVALVVVILLFL